MVRLRCATTKKVLKEIRPKRFANIGTNLQVPKAYGITP
jgi:hypothetical protein